MRINLTDEQWSDLVLIFLLDTIKKPKVMESTSDDFKEFMERGKVMKANLVRHFLNMDVEMRVKYRLIRNAFTRGARATIDINAEGDKT